MSPNPWAVCSLRRSEESDFRGTNPYGWTKFMIEQAMNRSSFRRHGQILIGFATANPSYSVTGPQK